MNDEQEQAAGFDFDTLTNEELDQVAESLGIELLPATEEGEGEAGEEAAEEVTEGEDGAEAEVAEEAAEGEDGAKSGGDWQVVPLDPGAMAQVAASCASEAAGYVTKLGELAAQVAQSDKAAGKKLEGIAKKAAGIASDVEKLAEKAKKAAEKDRLGEAADLAREASDTCAEIRELIDEAKALVGDADLPDDAEEAAAAPAAPSRSAIADWADDMLG